MSSPEPLPLPRGWTGQVRVAVLHVISLVQFSLACAEAKLAKRRRVRNRLRAENDRLRQEVELLREERRIKNARMGRMPAQKRPHYSPHERMAILELRAARGWNSEQTEATSACAAPGDA